jgi:hypothetical protein
MPDVEGEWFVHPALRRNTPHRRFVPLQDGKTPLVLLYMAAMAADVTGCRNIRPLAHPQAGILVLIQNLDPDARKARTGHSDTHKISILCFQ